MSYDINNRLDPKDEMFFSMTVTSMSRTLFNRGYRTKDVKDIIKEKLESIIMCAQFQLEKEGKR